MASDMTISGTKLPPNDLVSTLFSLSISCPLAQGNGEYCCIPEICALQQIEDDEVKLGAVEGIPREQIESILVRHYRCMCRMEAATRYY